MLEITDELHLKRTLPQINSSINASFGLVYMSYLTIDDLLTMVTWVPEVFSRHAFAGSLVGHNIRGVLYGREETMRRPPTPRVE